MPSGPDTIAWQDCHCQTANLIMAPIPTRWQPKAITKYSIKKFFDTKMMATNSLTLKSPIMFYEKRLLNQIDGADSPKIHWVDAHGSSTCDLAMGWWMDGVSSSGSRKRVAARCFVVFVTRSPLLILISLTDLILVFDWCSNCSSVKSPMIFPHLNEGFEPVWTPGVWSLAAPQIRQKQLRMVTRRTSSPLRTPWLTLVFLRWPIAKSIGPL